MNTYGALLFGFLQFTIKPAISLFRDEQDDEVTLIKAQQGVVISRFVGEDSPDTWPPAYIVQACSHRNGPDHLTTIITIICQVSEDKKFCEDSDSSGMKCFYFILCSVKL